MLDCKFCFCLIRTCCVDVVWFSAHVLSDELGDGAGQHEAGHGAAHDVEQGVHDPRAGGGFDRRAEGTAERAGSWSTAAAYLRRGGARPGETLGTCTLSEQA